MDQTVRRTLFPSTLAGDGGLRRRQVYAVCASLTARDSEREPGEGFASKEAFDENNPSPDLARLRLRSVTLSRKGRGEESSSLRMKLVWWFRNSLGGLAARMEG